MQNFKNMYARRAASGADSSHIQKSGSPLISVCHSRIFPGCTIDNVDSDMVSHPYSIYIWQPPLSSRDEGHWFEPLQAYTQEYALYAANLIHQDSRSVIKVVRYGLNIACFPDEHSVELVERQIAKQRQRRDEQA